MFLADMKNNLNKSKNINFIWIIAIRSSKAKSTPRNDKIQTLHSYLNAELSTCEVLTFKGNLELKANCNYQKH